MLAANVQISIDGRGHALDNIFTERLWRSVKYEDVYLHDYTTPRETRQELTRYFDFYDHERHTQPWVIAPRRKSISALAQAAKVKDLVRGGGVQLKSAHAHRPYRPYYCYGCGNASS